MDVVTLQLAKQYTKDSLLGAGAVQGKPGPQGEPGKGVPSGGKAGQVLAKSTGADYDTQWTDPPEGGGSTGGSPETPVQGFITQSEYDALPEAEKNGLYAIVGDSAADGGTSLEVYSTEEVRIGTWIDGKPLYRRVFQTSTPAGASVESSVEIAHIEIPVDTMVDIYGSSATKTRQHSPLPFYQSSTSMVYIAYNGPDHTSYPNSLRVSCSQNYTNTPIVIVLEYTKTTDSPEVSA